MSIRRRTKEQLLQDLATLRARNAELEATLSDVEDALQEYLIEPIDATRLPGQVRRRRAQVEAHAEAEREAARAALAQKVEELGRANVKLRQLDEMKANFLGLLSHELRTPISVIVGYAGILADDFAAAPPEHDEYVRKIIEESDKLLALVNNVLDMNRLMTGAMTIDRREVAFPEIVGNVVAQLGPAARRKGVRLVDQVPEALPSVWSDEQRLGQVLRNLVDNAIKFTPAGGTVTIRGHEADHSIYCEVSDTGVGIAADDIPRLFQVFGQLDPSATRQRGGMGLGLALVRELVVRMGGAIGVRSEPGNGSTFWFVVPIDRAAGRPKVDVHLANEGESRRT